MPEVRPGAARAPDRRRNLSIMATAPGTPDKRAEVREFPREMRERNAESRERVLRAVENLRRRREALEREAQRRGRRAR
jgi:hypothetical protein